MAETNNIAQMAAKLSSEIFDVFGWRRRGPTDSNYKCVVQGEHNRRTHPADVVFHYDQPYTSDLAVIHCDLKSYGASSLTKPALEAAVTNLSASVECAQTSAEWKELYEPSSANYDIFGLLFIYNHDACGSEKFQKAFQTLVRNPPQTRPNARVYILGPDRITYLATVANDINQLRLKPDLPSQPDSYSFYYPDLIDHKTSALKWRMPGTPSQLLGPFQVIKYKNDGLEAGQDGLVIYSSRTGSTINEFVYLLDYCSHYQLLHSAPEITIKLTFPAQSAFSNLEKAKERYSEHYLSSALLEKSLGKITLESIRNIVPTFSEIEIGMRND